MKPRTTVLFAALLCIAGVLFWLSRDDHDGISADQSHVKQGVPNLSANSHAGERMGTRSGNDGSRTVDRALQSRAKAVAIRGILDDDVDLLRKAIRMAPNDPYLLFLGSTHPLLTPDEHFEMSGRFYDQDTQNALAAFIFGSYLLKADDPAAALDVLRTSGSRPDYESYLNETWQLMNAHLIDEGHAPLEAKLKSRGKLEAGYLLDLRSTVDSLVSIAGDLPEDEASSIRSLASYMSRRISGDANSGTIIMHSLGLALEKASLEGMADDQPSPYEGMSVAEARAAIEDQRQQFPVMKYVELMKMMESNPQQHERFLDLSMRHGEIEALKWLLQDTQGEDR